MSNDIIPKYRRIFFELKHTKNMFTRILTRKKNDNIFNHLCGKRPNKVLRESYFKTW